MKLLAGLLVLCACTDNGGGGGGIDGETHVETYELLELHAPKLDLLFVIDDTTAMASHQQPLAALPAQLEQILEGATGIVAKYQFGVITTDAASSGNLRTSSTVNGPFVSHDNTFTGPEKNYTGTLAEALGSLFPSSAASTASNQPLATTRAALDGNAANAGFLREDAWLGIVTISASDDSSPAGVAEYASELKNTKIDPTHVIVSGVLDPAAARLAEFHAQFPNRNATHPIAATEYASALLLFTRLYTTVLGYACHKPPADVDPETAGPQYDCAFVSIENGVETRLPQCGAPITEPCWEIVAADPMICVDPAAQAHLQTRGYTSSMSAYGDPFHPAIRGQCIVN